MNELGYLLLGLGTLAIGAVGIVLAGRYIPKRGGWQGKWRYLWAPVALVVIGAVLTAAGPYFSSRPPTEFTQGRGPNTPPPPHRTPPSASPPTGPRTGCPINSGEGDEPHTELSVLNWCLHESAYLKGGRRELKLKPRIHNKTGHTIDISLSSWRLLVSTDVDVDTWMPIRDVRVAKPIRIDCGGIDAWAIPANANGVTYKHAFATHWSATKLAAGRPYADLNFYRGDIVWWTPNLTAFSQDGGILRAPQVLGVAVVNDGKIVAFSPSSSWTDETWTNPQDF